jgi:glyoxylase-like metal-dependent hydrolase (beta-lactamase superfamily II)
MSVSYTRGLHELGDGLFCYLQPDGGWGWSNAGLITSDGTSLLVDTLFDRRRTEDMLAAMRPVTERSPIGQAMNTHGNGDHWFGNGLLPDGIPIVATSAALAEMRAIGPQLVHALFNQLDLGPEFDAWAARTMRRFDFTSVEPRLPTEAFDGEHALHVGDREVRLLELGPAHTRGDAIAWVPDAGVVFSGDILFVDGTPIMWEGPVSHWLKACDRILELDARVIVPGHGPVTDASGVREVARYLRHVRDEARARFDAGLSAEAAADDIDLADFRDWGDPERIAVNVTSLYREFDPALPEVPPPELFVRMARWASRH